MSLVLETVGATPTLFHMVTERRIDTGSAETNQFVTTDRSMLSQLNPFELLHWAIFITVVVEKEDL